MLVPGPLPGILPDPGFKDAVHALQKIPGGLRARSLAIQGERCLEQKGIARSAGHAAHGNQGRVVGPGQGGGGAHGQGRSAEEGHVQAGQAAYLQIANQTQDFATLQHLEQSSRVGILRQGLDAIAVPHTRDPLRSGVALALQSDHLSRKAQATETGRTQFPVSDVRADDNGAAALAQDALEVFDGLVHGHHAVDPESLVAAWAGRRSAARQTQPLVEQTGRVGEARAQDGFAFLPTELCSEGYLQIAPGSGSQGTASGQSRRAAQAQTHEGCRED